MATLEAHRDVGRWKLLLALLAVVWLALRLPLLFRSIWFDEAFRTFVVLNPASIRDLLLHDVHNPLYNAFMYGWIRVFGDSEPSIRVPTLLAGAGVIGIVWVWCKSHWGERAAWWSAAWLVVNPVHVYYSCEAKNNMVTVLFAALALWRWDVMARALTARNVVLASLAGALAIWTDFQSLLVLPAVCVAWIVLLTRDSTRRRAWVTAAICVGATLVLTAPLLLFKAKNLDDLDRNYLRYFHVHEPVRLVLVYFSTGNGLWVTTRGNWPGAALTFAPLVLPSLIVGWLAVRKVSAGRVVLISLLAPVVITFVGGEVAKLFNPDLHIYQERNLLVMMPGLAIVLGVGMAGLRKQFFVWLSRWGLLVLGLVSSIAILTWNSERGTVMRLGRADWRSAAAVIREQERHERTLIAEDHVTVVVSRTPLLAMRYYMPSDNFVELKPRSESAAEEVIAEVREAMAGRGAGVCWLIVCEDWSPLTEEEMGAIRREFVVEEAGRGRGILVWEVREALLH
ncbi:MAG: glycosyltransferase family 39 protein [Phycisphaerales bacterium]